MDEITRLLQEISDTLKRIEEKLAPLSPVNHMLQPGQYIEIQPGREWSPKDPRPFNAD